MTMKPVITTGANGGAHVLNAPITTNISEQVSADLLTNEIDSRIVKIRPMSTPIDQISRMGKARHSKSMVTEYYSVDTTPSQTEVARDITASSSAAEVKLQVNNPNCFSDTDTVLIPEAECGGRKGIMFYVNSVDGSLNLKPIGLESSADTVSYTHLDVYKRQEWGQHRDCGERRCPDRLRYRPSSSTRSCCR